MTYVQFTEFRNNSRVFFEKVESGSSFIIIKKGKPVAKLIPFSAESRELDSGIKKVELKSKKQAGEYLRQEREGE